MPQVSASLTAPNRSPLVFAGWLLTLAAAATLAIPSLVRPGMFFDGLMYATVSRNMAVGIGDAWHPVYCASWGGNFREAPPLAFVLESYCFRLFGDHFWVEKLYSALTGLGTALFMLAIWRRLAKENRPLRDWGWLPILFWITLPGWMAIYGNNLLEGTMGLFTIAAVYASLRAAEGWRTMLVWLPAAALCIVAALLSKGPVGLFPLATPALIALTLGWNQRKACGEVRSAATPHEALSDGSPSIGRWRAAASAFAPSIALLALTGGFLGLVFLQPGAFDGLMSYLHDQVFASLAGHREASTSSLGRFYIVREIVRELIVPTAVAAGIVLRARLRGICQPKAFESTRPAMWLCLLIGLGGSLPIMLSPKQFNWYVFPSCPFYALAIALWCGPALVQLRTNRRGAMAAVWNRRVTGLAMGCAMVMLACGLASALHRPPRELGIYHDALELGRVAPKSSVVSCVGFSMQQIHDDGAMPSYLARCDYISTVDKPGSHYMLMPVGSQAVIPAGYRDLPTGMQHYRLLLRADDIPLATTAKSSEQPPLRISVAPNASALLK